MKAVARLLSRSGLLKMSYMLSTPRGGPPSKMQNEPEKCFRINKSWQKRTRNEPERTRSRDTAEWLSALKSARVLGFPKNEPETNLKTNPSQVSGFELQVFQVLAVRFQCWASGGKSWSGEVREASAMVSGS